MSQMKTTVIVFSSIKYTNTTKCLLLHCHCDCTFKNTYRYCSFCLRYSADHRYIYLQRSVSVSTSRPTCQHLWPQTLRYMMVHKFTNCFSLFLDRYIANQNRLFEINDNSLSHYINLRNL